MQTFVPSPISFDKNASLLDYRRLGKQRVEAQQILNSLEGGGGWATHPAVLMWRGYETALRQYLRAIIQEWVRRGYNNTMVIPRRCDRVVMPDWWGGPIHATHRAALMAKDPVHYGIYGWTEEPVIDYYWPTKEKTNG